MDICQTVNVNGATFVARTTSFEKGLPGMLETAIQNNGFSLIDIWELCTAYFVPNNHFSKGQLERILAEYHFQTGIIQHVKRPEYSLAYRQSVVGEFGKPAVPSRPIQEKYEASLTADSRIIIAGAAGKKINTAASLFARGAVLSGLCVTQRNDYPVTVKSGHSVSEVILSREEIGYTGITRPDALLLLFKEGLSVVRPQINAMTIQDTLVVNQALLPIQTKARVIPIDFEQLGRWKNRKEYWAVIAMARLLSELKIYPLDAFKEAVSARSEFAKDNLEAIEAGAQSSPAIVR